MAVNDDGQGGSGRESDYWAGRKSEEMVTAIRKRVRDYVNYCEQTGRTRVWRKAHASYYGTDPDQEWNGSASVNFGGEQGENTLLRVNQYGSLLDRAHQLVTGSRPSFSCRPANSDYKSLAQAKVGDNVLAHYYTVKGIEEQCTRATRYAQLYWEGWVFIGWDARAGEAVDFEPMSEPEPMEGMGAMEGDESAPPPEPKVQHEGDITTRVYMPQDIARDVDADDFEDVNWVVAHKRVNRWDLAARFPDKAEAILAAPSYDPAYDRAMRNSMLRRVVASGDRVGVLELWHDRTDALPDGRYVWMCGDAVLMDTPLPFESAGGMVAGAFAPMMPCDEDGRPFGFSRMTDLLALQDANDSVVSTILTNHDAFGRHMLWVPPGTKIQASDITGLTIVESPEMPQVVNLNQTGQASYALSEKLTGAMEQISGINSVVRGEPDASITSGSFAALIYSAAVQANSGLQKAYARLFEVVGSAIISRMKTFAKTKRIVEIAGKNNGGLMVEFSGDSLSDIQRVVVELGSSITQTTAGRKDLADKFFEASLQTSTPMSFEKYMEIMTTGQLDPIAQRPHAERMCIVRENEGLMEGQPQVVLVTDMHEDHINEHLVLLADPSVRFDPVLGPLVLAHVQDHVNKWTTADLSILAATGQRPAPAPPMPPGMDPMAMGNPGGGGPLAIGDGSIPNAPLGGDMTMQPPGVQAPGMPNLPNLPPGSDPGLQEAAQAAGGVIA
jgi:hypothetical protein